MRKGNLIRLGPPGSPFAWYDPSDLASITSSSSLVSQLADKSGNARHLTAAGGARPTTGAATINGLNVITGFALGVSLQSAAITQAQPFTTFMVGNLSSTVAANQEILGNGVTTPTVLALAGVWEIYAGTLLPSAVATDTNPHVFSAVFNGASSTLYLDGALIASGDAGASGYAANSICYGNSLNPTANNPWSGPVGEAVLYASALAATPRQAVEAYLKAKWGTP